MGPEGAPVPDLVFRQLEETARRDRGVLSRFCLDPRTRRFPVLPFLPAAGVMVALFVLFEEFPVLFIASTLVLYMGYPVLFLIPPEISSVRKGIALIPDLARAGKVRTVRTHAKSLVHILWNVFFINATALAPPFILLFVLDLIFLAAGWVVHGKTTGAYLIVCLQCGAIITYYAGIWVTRPYSIDFEKTVRSLYHGPGRKGPVSLWFLVLLVGTVATLMALITVIAVFMPGLTFGSVVAEREFYGIGTTVEFVLTLSALFLVVREIHGWSSLLVVRDHLAARVLATDALTVRVSHTGRGLAWERAAKRAVRVSQIYRPAKRTILGHLAVYLIKPDVQVLFDPSVLDGMDGHTRIAG